MVKVDIRNALGINFKEFISLKQAFHTLNWALDNLRQGDVFDDLTFIKEDLTESIDSRVNSIYKVLFEKRPGEKEFKFTHHSVFNKVNKGLIAQGGPDMEGVQALHQSLRLMYQVVGEAPKQNFLLPQADPLDRSEYLDSFDESDTLPAFSNSNTFFEVFISMIGRLVDIYAVSLLLQPQKNDTLMYLGSSHCKNIQRILTKRFGFSVVAASKDPTFPRWENLENGSLSITDLHCTNVSCIPNLTEPEYI